MLYEIVLISRRPSPFGENCARLRLAEVCGDLVSITEVSLTVCSGVGGVNSSLRKKSISI